VTLVEHALRGAVLEPDRPCRLRIGLPWYRSLPLSAILGIDLTLDGRSVTGLRLRSRDRVVPVGALATQHASWFLQDRYELEWDGPAPSAPTAEVVVRMRLQLPNLVGPGGSAVQVLQEVRASVPARAA